MNGHRLNRSLRRTSGGRRRPGVVGVTVIASGVLALSACSDDQSSAPTVVTSIPNSTAVSTSTVSTPREYPAGVRAVDERPSGEPQEDFALLTGGPVDIDGFGSVKLLDASDPPQLSWLLIHRDIGDGYQFGVTLGDRFEIDGFVFEITNVNPELIDFDVWAP